MKQENYTVVAQGTVIFVDGIFEGYNRLAVLDGLAQGLEYSGQGRGGFPRGLAQPERSHWLRIQERPGKEHCTNLVELLLGKATVRALLGLRR